MRTLAKAMRKPCLTDDPCCGDECPCSLQINAALDWMEKAVRKEAEKTGATVGMHNLVYRIKEERG